MKKKLRNKSSGASTLRITRRTRTTYASGRKSAPGIIVLALRRARERKVFPARSPRQKLPPAERCVYTRVRPHAHASYRNSHYRAEKEVRARMKRRKSSLPPRGRLAGITRGSAEAGRGGGRERVEKRAFALKTRTVKFSYPPGERGFCAARAPASAD